MRRVVYILLPVLIVLIALGYGGWRAWRSHNSSALISDTESGATSTTEASSDISPQVYDDPGLGFSISYPGDWRQVPCTDDFCASHLQEREEKVVLVKGPTKIVIDPIGRVGRADISDSAEELEINGEQWVRAVLENAAPTPTSTLKARHYYRYDLADVNFPSDDTVINQSLQSTGGLRLHLFVSADSSREMTDEAVRTVEAMARSLVLSYPNPPRADSPTGAWQKYFNRGFYSISYPKGWCLKGGSSASFTNSPCGRSPVPLSKNEIQVNIQLLNLPHLNTVEDWLNAQEAFDVQETVLDGERAVWAKSKSSFGDTHVTLVALRENTFYLIEYSPTDSDLKSVFDTMLNSFTFASLPR